MFPLTYFAAVVIGYIVFGIVSIVVGFVLKYLANDISISMIAIIFWPIEAEIQLLILGMRLSAT